MTSRTNDFVKIGDSVRFYSFNIVNLLRERILDGTFTRQIATRKFIFHFLCTFEIFHQLISLPLQLSFLGNWCVKPETLITPCDKKLLGTGPMQDETTQKHDFTWKLTTPPTEIRQEDNLTFSPLPLECESLIIKYSYRNLQYLHFRYFTAAFIDQRTALSFTSIFHV